MTILPLVALIYDLDNEGWTANRVDGSDARCVGAEAAVLARRELQRIAGDEFKRRLTHDEAISLQAKLAPFLANGDALCK